MKKIAEQLAMLEKLKTFVLSYSLLIGAQGTRLLRDIEVTGDPAGAIAPRRLKDLPAESECPEWKSTDLLEESLINV
jgi:hypothetical protein